MHIRIINPNTTAAFTRSLARDGAAVAAAGTFVDAVSPSSGTLSIESHVEEAIGALGVLEVIRDSAGVDGFVLACFGDTGLSAAREATGVPVVGITEAAYFAAAMLAARFSVITLPPRTRIHAERVLRETGLAARCARVRAIDLPVLDMEADPAAALAALLAEARLALAEDDAEAIVLGCAGLTPLVGPMQDALGVPVIDGVTVAVKMAEGLVSLGLRTSKRGSFDTPPVKGLTGPFAGLFREG